MVDHVNGDGLDNRRSNLRIVRPGQNQYNSHTVRKGTSKYKGVTFHKRLKKWQASIRKQGKATHLGTFEHEVDAAVAYDKAALKLFKGFAHPNFPRRLIERLSEAESK